MSMLNQQSNGKERLLLAAIDVIRAKGYSGTRVDDIAAAAGVTKGSFFHHFPTKEACARAAAAHWSTLNRFSSTQAGHDCEGSAADRVLAYIDFRASMLVGPVQAYACYVGTVLQEVHDTYPMLAADSAVSLLGQAATIEAELAEALGSPDEARGLSLHIEAVIQGALLIAKAQGGSSGARASLSHLRRYLELRLKEQKE